jgi:hypothetical protein
MPEVNPLRSEPRGMHAVRQTEQPGIIGRVPWSAGILPTPHIPDCLPA